MARKYRHIAFLLIALLAFQSVLAAGVTICGNSSMTGEDSHDMADRNHHKHVVHKDDTVKSANHAQHQSVCDCGNYCAGTCMYTCNGATMITTIYVMSGNSLASPFNLVPGPFVQGYSTVPLRPPSLT